MADRLLRWIKKKKTGNVENTPVRPYGLPTLRPRQLTPSASRESLLISAAAATADSGFFQKLPLEIRQMILWHAFGGNVIHMRQEFVRLPKGQKYPVLGSGPDATPMRLWSHMCLAPETSSTLSESQYYQYWQTYNKYRRGSGLWCTCPTNSLGSCYIEVMGWLLSCRQAIITKMSLTDCLLDFLVSSYAECIDILYGQNTIYLITGIRDDLQKMILPQRLGSITSVGFFWSTHRFCSSTQSFEYNKRLHLFVKKSLTTFPHLQKLHVSLNLFTTDAALGTEHSRMFEAVEESIMVPMDHILKCSGSHLKECNISIHVGYTKEPFVSYGFPVLEYTHFQGIWTPPVEKHVLLDDSTPHGSCDDSLALRNLESPSYTLEAVFEPSP